MRTVRAWIAEMSEEKRSVYSHRAIAWLLLQHSRTLVDPDGVECGGP